MPVDPMLDDVGARPPVCPEVEQAIASHRPRTAVVNGGEARFLEGGTLVTTTDDLREVAARVPVVVVVHLEAVNHCVDTRADVRARVPGALLPEDGETLALGSRAQRAPRRR